MTCKKEQEASTKDVTVSVLDKVNQIRSSAHLIYPERETIFLPLNQSYRGVGIYRTADKAGQTNGHVDNRWHIYHTGRI